MVRISEVPAAEVERYFNFHVKPCEMGCASVDILPRANPARPLEPCSCWDLISNGLSG